MTHGDERYLASFDLDYKLNLITKYFTDKRCPSLKDKPRIIWIQACRGNRSDFGYVLTKAQALKERSYFASQEENRHHQQDPDAGEDNEKESGSDEDNANDEEDMAHNPPIHKDFLIVRSAMPSHESYRNPKKGSWFIQELCIALEMHAIGSPMLDLMTFVNESVSKRKTGCVDKKKQTLCISSMLSRILIFNDKSEQASNGQVEDAGDDDEAAEQLLSAVD